MSARLWERRPVPAHTSQATLLASWRPEKLQDITERRRELARRLDLEHGDAGAVQGAIERLLLCVEELASNALRHGRPPVEVRITSYDRFWLLEVTDAAPDVPPSPAVGRDAADGGLGLYVVARVCGAHGWTVAGAHKILWARIDHSRAEVPPEVLASIPKPRLSIAEKG